MICNERELCFQVCRTKTGGVWLGGCEGMGEEGLPPPYNPVTLYGLGTGYRPLGHSAKTNRPLWCFMYWVVSILLHSVQGWGYRKVFDSGCIFLHVFIYLLHASVDIYIHIHVQIQTQVKCVQPAIETCSSSHSAVYSSQCFRITLSLLRQFESIPFKNPGC